jgi:hypothetical protein
VLAGERQREASTLADLKTQRAATSAKPRQSETEAAICYYVYVAELIGADTELAIGWPSLLIHRGLVDSRSRVMAAVARHPPGAPQHHRLQRRAPRRRQTTSGADPRPRTGGNKRDESAPPAVFRRWRKVSFGQGNSYGESKVRLSRPREETSKSGPPFSCTCKIYLSGRVGRSWAPSCPQTIRAEK